MSQGFDSSLEPDFPPQKPAGFGPGDPYGHETKSGRGCFFYGCITALILFMLGCVGIFIGVRMALNQFQKAVETYTDSAPAKLPTVEMPEDQRQEVEKRVAKFQKLFDGTPPEKLDDLPERLVLDADDINAMIEQKPELRSRVFVRIDDDQFNAEVSIPLNEFPGMKGRYLNAKARIEASIDGGIPVLRLRDMQVKGRPLPAQFRQGFENVNWLQNAKTSDKKDLAPLIASKIEKIEVKDGKLIIIPRKPSAETAETPAPKDSEKKTEPEPEKKAESEPEKKAEPDAEKKAEAPAEPPK